MRDPDGIDRVRDARDGDQGCESILPVAFDLEQSHGVANRAADVHVGLFKVPQGVTKLFATAKIGIQLMYGRLRR